MEETLRVLKDKYEAMIRLGDAVLVLDNRNSVDVNNFTKISRKYFNGFNGIMCNVERQEKGCAMFCSF